MYAYLFIFLDSSKSVENLDVEYVRLVTAVDFRMDLARYNYFKIFFCSFKNI